MAVAAASGSFVVYTLKTMAQLREEVESPTGLLQDKFVPVKSVSNFLPTTEIRNSETEQSCRSDS